MLTTRDTATSFVDGQDHRCDGQWSPWPRPAEEFEPGSEAVVDASSNSFKQINFTCTSEHSLKILLNIWKTNRFRAFLLKRCQSGQNIVRTLD
jgi:hypothetical protein